MIKNEHFRRLEHIYASELPGSDAGHVSVNFGRALLNADLADRRESTVGGKDLPHQKLMSDAAALAAGSLEKERTVSAESFDMNVHLPEYAGEVVATARVVMAQPPKFVVQAALLTPEGEVIAEAQGVYEPTDQKLPPDPNPDLKESGEVAMPGRANTHAETGAPTAERSTPEPQPATFMPVFPTPVGMLCLN
ncbi:hypothetical protein CRI94_03065 [Longibacter salinarum]|uniref:Thioesterase domain-containing protein n=1 Tax=Longibacter salinarum TaxID=1850348 RepID=A0A2A8D328_9BACT|nr:hypothetical protein [Longibacter salinarum]PEN15274.1 hypothetical protein CRI94_03065 [Longibacter salinarum]